MTFEVVKEEPEQPKEFRQPGPLRRDKPHTVEVLESAFRTENDVLALSNMLERPAFQMDPEFDLKGAIEQSEVFALSPDDFIDVESQAEFDFMEQKVLQLYKDRQTMQEGGTAGILFGMLSGALSPTIVLPFGGAGKGVVGGAKGALKWGLVGASAQEAVLALDQGEQRTGAEIATGIGTATVLSGLLGSAAGLLTKADVARIEAGMDATHGITSVPTQPRSAVGAQQTAQPVEVRRLAAGTGEAVLNKIPFAQSPIVRSIQQTSSDTISGAVAMLSTGGLKLRSGAEAIAIAARGGTVESRIKGYGLNLYRGLVGLNDEYSNMRKSGSARMTRQEFRIAVGKAMERGDSHEVPEVQAAARRVRAEIDEIFGRGVEVGLFDPENVDLKGSESYLTRIYNTLMISRERTAFAEMLEQNALEQLEEFFDQRYKLLEERRAQVEQDISDVSLNEGEAAVLREQLEAKNRQLHDTEAAFRQREIDTARALMRAAQKAGNKAEEAEAKALLDSLEPQAQDVVNFRKARAAIRRRFRNLDNTRQGLEQRQARVLQQMREIEAQQIASLNRVVKMSRTFLKKMDKLSDAQIEKELDKLQTQVDKTLGIIERGEERMLKLQAGFGVKVDEVPLLAEADLAQKITDLKGQQAGRRERLDRLFERQQDVLDRTELREELQGQIDASLSRINATNNKRAERLMKLRERAQKLDPEQVNSNIEALRERVAKMEDRFDTQMRNRGATGVDLKKGKGDFTAKVKDDVQDVIGNITGETRRVVGIDMLTGSRGPEKARMLHIDPTREWHTSQGVKTLEDFLERDIDTILRAYTRTVAPDIEIKRAFGSLNPFNADEAPGVPEGFVDPAGNITPFIQRQQDELRLKQEEIGRKLKAGALTEKEAGDAQIKLLKENDQGMEDLQVMIQRLRHQRGLPTNPEDWGYRAAKILLHLNTLRLMGTVIISSIPDMARPIMKYGLTNSFRDGFVPMVTNLKAIRMSQQEAKLAGVALDPVIHGRAMGVFDELDSYAYGTKGERGLEYLSNRMGMIALFDYWTSGMKQFTAGIVNGKLMESIETILSPTPSAKALKEAQDFLSHVNIDEKMARQIWAEVQSAEGGGKFNGVWVPNTESWTSREAQRAYRSALAQEVDDTIVTPGLERPNWVDASIYHRLLAQFRSFAMSSTTKTVMAAGQDVRAGGAAQVTNGMLFSLALGALSYYTWAISVGGKAEEDMLKASPEKWADEAIDRSGLLGVLAELHKVGQQIPAIQPYMTFSGDRTTRRTGQGFADQLLGPSYRLLFEDAARFVAGVDDPTQSTVHTARKMAPFQNVFYLRRMFIDPFEQGVNETFNIPERRK